MILRAIEVKGWRCLANRCRLGDFSDGINIIYAPNGSGKSTVFEALRRGLFDGYKVSGTEIDQIRPWGRNVAPSVAIEFVHAGAEYRLVKQFLDEQSAELFRKEDGRYVLTADGPRADAEARALVAAEQPGRGLSKEQHWGLAQVLWVPQGKLACAELTGGLLNSIHGALNVQVAESASGELEKQIESAYLKTFAPNGKVRRGAGAPEWVAWEVRLNELQQERPALVEKVTELEDTSRQVQDQRARRQAAAQDELRVTALIEQARQDAQKYAALFGQKNQHEAEARRCESEYKQLDSRITQIRERRAESDTQDEQIATLTGRVPVLESQVQNAEQNEQAANKQLADARKTHLRLEDLRQHIREAERLAHSTSEASRLAALLKNVDQSAATLRQLQEQQAKTIAPDDKALKAIRTAIQKRVESQARFEASLITLEITPERDGVVDVLVAETVGESPVSSGKAWRVSGVREIVVNLKGVAAIAARGPAGSTEDMRTDLTKALKKVGDLTSPFGTDDLHRLEELHDSLKQHTQATTHAEENLERLLDGKTREEILQEEAAHEHIRAELFKLHSDWNEQAVDTAALRQELQQHQSAAPSVSEAEIRWHGEQTQLAAARQGLALCHSNLTNAQSLRQSLQRQLENLRTDGLDESARANALNPLSLQWTAARSALERANIELAAFPEDPAQLVANFEKQLSGIRQLAEQCLTDEKLAQGRLQTLIANAPFTALAKSDEEIEKLREAIAREKLHADSIKLLHDTVAMCTVEMFATISGPVEACALSILDRVAGKRLSGIRLGESFQLDQITPSTQTTSVSVENLSGGEQEQIHLAVRLALAQVLAAKERQLVVLDDVLIATDAARLNRILTVLNELSQRLQIIVLTCHPERYYALADAALFDLEKIRLE